jgi:hypothetical protein
MQSKPEYAVKQKKENGSLIAFTHQKEVVNILKCHWASSPQASRTERLEPGTTCGETAISGLGYEPRLPFPTGKWGAPGS